MRKNSKVKSLCAVIGMSMVLSLMPVHFVNAEEGTTEVIQEVDFDENSIPENTPGENSILENTPEENSISENMPDEAVPLSQGNVGGNESDEENVEDNKFEQSNEEALAEENLDKENLDKEDSDEDDPDKENPDNENPDEEDPNAVTDAMIQKKIDELYKEFGESYFNAGRDTACGGKSGGHACSNCFTRNIVQAQWFIDMFGTVTAEQFPFTYIPSGEAGKSFIYGAANSCAGFAAFAEWYIFKNNNTDTIKTEYVGMCDFDKASVEENLKKGDLIRLDNAHSAIFVEANDKGILVLDSNWIGTYNCTVKLHTINYKYYSKITISRVDITRIEPPKEEEKPVVGPEGTTAMYRMYNPNSGEHFYTANFKEKQNLVSVGWKYEGVAWYAPVEGNPVYRLYNPNAGDHHYTLSEEERDDLMAFGWKYEGVAWYSGGDVPLYRAYNPNAQAGSHHYTINKKEVDTIVSYGWRYEGVAWYGVQ